MEDELFTQPLGQQPWSQQGSLCTDMRPGVGSGGSILSHVQSTEQENIPAPDMRAAAKAALYAYKPERQPAKSALRKSMAGGEQLEDENSKLKAKLSVLEGEMQHFCAQTQRRDSLSGRPSVKQEVPQQQADIAGSTGTGPNAPRPAAVHQDADMGMSQDDDCTVPMFDKARDKEAIVVLPGDAPSSSRYVMSASDIFLEPGLKRLINDGLNKQLQRTKDGANEKSRISELADLVKLLRKCVREMGSRTSMYVGQCVQLEKEYVQEVETVQLSSKTAMRQLEADLAAARQSLAEAERDLKGEKAAWGVNLDTQKAEVARLNRELERLTEERARARDDCLRAEQARQQLESELKEARRSLNQQLREVSVNQGEAVRVLTEDRIAAENKYTGLKELYDKQVARLAELQECLRAKEQESIQATANIETLQALADNRETALQLQQEQNAKLQENLHHCQEGLQILQGEHSTLQQQLSTATQERDALLASILQRDEQLADVRSRLEAMLSTLQAERAAWQQEWATLEAALANGMEERAQLAQGNNLLKGALTSALEQKDVIESQATQLQMERSELLRERAQLLNQAEFAADNQAQAERRATALAEELKLRDEQLQASKQVLQERQAKLEQLEGEFGALKEVLGEAAASSSGAAHSQDIVTALLSKISALQGAVNSAEAARRKLHNELVDLRGNIRVYCRVRPHPNPAVRCGPDSSVILSVDGKDHSFAYDRVFGPNSSQDEVFSQVSELVQSALDGYHVCLFSYGQTGAGKTHTMQGTDSGPGRGIIPRSVEKVLAAARKLEEQGEWLYKLEASFIEIYNNQLRDLLQNGTCINDQNAIKHDPDGGHTLVVGVSKVPVDNVGIAADLVRKAAAARAVEATAMNATSSRSHSVFMLYITGSHASTGTRLQGCLCLVDLAGSERLDRSLAEGQAKKEACAINQSLSALGDVFAALSSKSSHVPYRNSKLTYLLQPCLGGNGKTLMFVNITAESASAAESLCSLRFAVKVNGCETGAKGGARRNMATLAAAAPGPIFTGPSPAAPQEAPAAGSKRLSVSGLPRPPTTRAAAPSGGMDAASRRISLAPSRSVRGAPLDKRLSLPGIPQGASTGASRSTAAGQKRPAGGGVPTGGNAAKRMRM